MGEVTVREKVGILLATYNGEQYIREQLDSILNQTYVDWVCYIHDDGSTDNTWQTIKKYEADYPDKFVVLNYEKCGGACKNFISLMKYSSENYIMFSDQDDVWAKNKIEVTLNRMKSIEADSDKPYAVFTDLYVVDENLEIISKSFMSYSKHKPNKLMERDLFVANPAPGCTMMVNRKLLQMASLCKHPEEVEMHDWWCMLIASIFGQIAYLDEPTIYYRQHGTNTLGAVDRHAGGYYLEVLKSIVLGRRYNETRGRVIAKRKMAKEVVECFDDLLPKDSIAIQLAKIEGRTKLERMKFYWRNHLYNTMQHGIWIMMAC